MLNGECILVTQISDDQGTGESANSPRTRRQGLRTFYATEGNQAGGNADGSSEVIRFDRRAFEKNRPNVLLPMTDGASGQDSAGGDDAGEICSTDAQCGGGGTCEGQSVIYLFDRKRD